MKANKYNIGDKVRLYDPVMFPGRKWRSEGEVTNIDTSSVQPYTIKTDLGNIYTTEHNIKQVI